MSVHPSKDVLSPVRSATAWVLVGVVSWLALLQILVAEAVTVSSWQGQYSRHDQPISELGVRVCNAAGDCTSSSLMNFSIGLAGVLIAVGAVAFAVTRRIPVLAAVFFVAGAGGLLLVALYPLSTPSPLHSLGAHAFFALSSVGLLVTGTSLLRTVPVFAYGALVTGTVGLGAFLLFSAEIYGPLGLGGMQRAVVYSSIAGYVIVAACAATSVRAERTTSAG